MQFLVDTLMKLITFVAEEAGLHADLKVIQLSQIYPDDLMHPGNPSAASSPPVRPRPHRASDVRLLQGEGTDARGVADARTKNYSVPARIIWTDMDGMARPRQDSDDHVLKTKTGGEPLDLWTKTPYP